MAKQTEQEKAAAAMKVDPSKSRFTSAEALQEGADRMSLRYGKKTRDEILEDRKERADAAAQAERDRAAALSADADETGTSRPAAKKTTAAKKAETAPASGDANGDTPGSNANAGDGD